MPLILLLLFFFPSFSMAATASTPTQIYLYVTSPTSTATTTPPVSTTTTPAKPPEHPQHSAPPKIESFSSTVFLNSIILSWNIVSGTWYSIPTVRILRSTEGYPSDPLDGGKVVYEGYASAFFDNTVLPNTPYFYSLFVRNPNGSYSAAFTANEVFLYNPENPFPDLSLGIPNGGGGTISVKVPFDSMFCENKYANLFCKTANGLFIKTNDQNQSTDSYPFFVFLDALIRVLVPWWWLIIIVFAVLAKLSSMIFRRR